MIGSPPGYVGYDEGGQLTEQVRRRPYSVVLFDEIEKAHPDVFNTLLQILDDGRLTDGQGRTVSFKNTVIVMTSQRRHRHGRDATPSASRCTPRTSATDDTRKRLLDALRSQFRPEFLNRVDDIIVFNSLTREHLAQIVDIQLDNVGKLLEGSQAETRSHRRRQGPRSSPKATIPQYGARPMRRAIQRLIQDPLALKLINGDFLEGDTILVDAAPEGAELHFAKLVPSATGQWTLSPGSPEYLTLMSINTLKTAAAARPAQRPPAGRRRGHRRPQRPLHRPRRSPSS